jgi:radical SAM superfamily enzyme YgiQ (UPF0313 family)
MKDQEQNLRAFKYYQSVLIRVERAPSELPGHPRHIHPPLELKYIQAGLYKYSQIMPLIYDGWLINSSPKETIRNILSLNAHIAVIKTSSPCIEESLKIGKALKQKGLFVIAINRQAHAGSFDEYFDFFLSGESELIVPLIIRDFILDLARKSNYFDPLSQTFIKAVKKIKNLYPLSGTYLVENPDDLPVPVFNKDELAMYPFPFPVACGPVEKWGYVMATRGCPHACLHCSGVVRKSWGRKYRKRNVKKIVSEIENLLAQGAEGIIFEDDSLFSDTAFFQSLCDEIVIRQVHFPWIAHARADHLTPVNVASAARAGAVLLKIGVESGSSKILQKIGKCRDGKRWLENVKKGFSLLKEFKIGGVTLFLVGAPDENIRDVLKSIALAKSIQPDYIQVQIFCLYPDTELAKHRPDIDLKNNLNNLYHYSDQSYTASNISPHELGRLQLLFYKIFYFRPSFILGHLLRYYAFYFKKGSLARLFKIITWMVKGS